MTPQPAKLIERDVAKQLRDFLEFRGWRRVRMTVGMAMGGGGMMSLGERGMPDLLYIRYFTKPRGGALAFWAETKRPGGGKDCRCRAGDKKLCRHCQQRKWREEERLRGALVVVVDDLREFHEWYDSTFGWLHSGPLADGQLRLGL